MERKTALLAGIGAACAAAAGYLLSRRATGGGGIGDRFAPALSTKRPAGPVGNSGSARAAGPEAMRDPPEEWTRVDQASDESFPASDPPNLSPHIDQALVGGGHPLQVPSTVQPARVSRRRAGLQAACRRLASEAE